VLTLAAHLARLDERGELGALRRPATVAGMPRFLHTGDWQLGMTRHFLADEAQARFTAARFDAIREIGRVAEQEACEFVVVCGDVFETNQVDRRTVSRAADALAAISVPVFLLPGNHDPLDAGSVFRSPTFLARKPPHVVVLDDASPREVRPGLEVVGAPWTSKRPLRDLVAAAAAPLEPWHGVVRVMVAHGAVDTLSPDPDNPAVIRLADAQTALAAGRYHYLALGDRHSLTQVDPAGRVWYAGSPVATDFDETHPGCALVVDVTEEAVSTSPREIGAWRFRTETRDLMNDADLDAFERLLRGAEAKDRTVLRLVLRGALTLRQHARLDGSLDELRDLFAAVDVWKRHSEIAVVADDGDFEGLQLSGFAQAALERLRAQAQGSEAAARAARDALALLVRLAGSRA
jgi:DNA repair exonuclease SbcCD nuclease subunit